VSIESRLRPSSA